MAAKHLIKLALLALPLFTPAHADTNVKGVEITLLDSDVPYKSEYLEESETPTEPVLADAAQENDGNLWQRIKSGYAMPDLQSPYTARHESWYASRPDYVKRMVERSQKYLYHIVEQVQQRGMPTEIALLPMVESAFNPQAYSRSKAAGIWQFIPSTGRNFGLKQNWWVDNRRDITAATDAALTYLQKLHVMFGSWELALAAYNAGEGTVMRAIARNRKKGLPTDYQSLSLPQETKNYVPKLQAVKNIITNPEKYGLELQPIADEPYFTKVVAPKQIDAHLAAKLAGISFEEFSALNPEYNRPVLSAADGDHEILLPVGADKTFEEALANYDKPLVSWQTYVAKAGEKQTSIARKFGITLAELRDINDLPQRSRLKRSRPLLVPAKNQGEDANLAPAELASIAEESTSTDHGTSEARYVVKKGESLGMIAKKNGLSAKSLMALNHLKSSRIKAGQVLLVQQTAPAKAETQAARKIHYVVRRGDTLISIARKFDVAATDLKRWNNLSDSLIVPGDKLKILKADA